VEVLQQIPQATTATGAKAQEFEQQVRILKLEKELEKARQDLFSLRKESYTKPKTTNTTAPEPSTTL
jgi:hypothetical protein